MSPILFIDVETTGFSAAIHAPIAVAAVCLGGDNHDARFHARMRPFDSAMVEPKALEVNKYTLSQIYSFPDPMEKCHEFCTWINEKFPAPMLVQPAGWNYHFDERFLREWILRYNFDSSFYGNTFNPEFTEGKRGIKAMYPDWQTRFPSKGGMTLPFQYEYNFGIPLKDAHTELADALATRDLFLLCDKHKDEPEYEPYHYLMPCKPPLS